ncbi:MAG: hypothetical protein KGL10_05735 [Alphaproteobacteria bacterium]|nr:hypothetical protein [Alphaproteobacteria bacterium]MDE2336794.1 hypothetical protein [Alphaproteobacteria bacterium]
MSVMCKISDKCAAREGMCTHEKWISALIVLAAAAVAAAGRFYFHWY